MDDLVDIDDLSDGYQSDPLDNTDWDPATVVHQQQQLIRSASTMSDNDPGDSVLLRGQYHRPPHTALGDFMLVDVEMMYGLLEFPIYDDPEAVHYSIIDPPGLDSDDDEEEQQVGSKRKFHKYKPSQRPVNVPMVRMYGVDNAGSSVMLDLFGFYPAFRIRVLQGDLHNSDNFVMRLCRYLEGVLFPAKQNQQGPNYYTPRQIVSAKIVSGFPAFPYCEKPIEFIELRLADPKHVRTLSTYFTAHPDLDDSTSGNVFIFAPYTGEDALTQFMVEADLAGFGWVHVKENSATRADMASPLTNATRVRESIVAGLKYKTMTRSVDEAAFSPYRTGLVTKLAEVNANTCSARYVANWKSVSAVHDNDSIAPLRVLSIDIECLKDAGIPDPTKNSVIIIGAIISTSKDALFEDISSVKNNLMMGLHPRTGKDSPLALLTTSAALQDLFTAIYSYGKEDRKVIFAWSNGTEINTGHGVDPARDQYLYGNETDMMIAFGNFVRTYDPDVIVGHNIMGFDIPYLLIRANTLHVDIASELGRRSISASYGKWVPPKEIKRVRKNGETRTTLRGDTPGRIQLDTLPFVQGQTKESSYKLGALAAKYLGDSKDDVGYNMIAPLFKESPETRKRLRLYCLKDVELSLGLVKHRRFNMLMSTVALARETKVPAAKLLRSGAQEKVRTLILHKAAVPHFDDTGIPVFFPYEVPKSREKDNKFKGATVLQPIRGYSDPSRPVATGDFKSLYPSTMISNNICYTTEILDKDALDKVPHNTSPTDIKFATREVRKGILPQVLEALLGAREQAKKQLKACKDPALKKFYDTKQLQLKIIANSCYGALTASGGWFVRMELGESVTSWGRAAIDRARAIAMGPPFNGNVIYGDTDSIMIQFPDANTVDAAFVKLDAVCKAVTDTFPKPMELQAEKVYSPHLQLGKKRYVGLCHIKGEKPKIDSKGVEKNRLDNCPLVRKTMETVFKLLFEKNDLKAALAHTKQVAADLIQGRVEMADLVITKSISKDNYAGKMIHVEVANKMKARDPSYMVAPGERIPYVMVLPSDIGPIKPCTIKPSARSDGIKMYELAEDPLWSITHRIPVNISYYINKQLASPLARIFMWYIGDKSEIAHIHTLEKKLYSYMTDAETKRIQNRIDVLKTSGENAAELEELETRMKNRITLAKYEEIEGEVDKLVKKLTVSVGTQLFGDAALSSISKVSSRPFGPLMKFFKPTEKEQTQEEMDKKMCDLMDLQEKLRSLKDICTACRGYEDTTGKIACQQRDCTNLFRIAKTTRDIEDLC